MMAWEIRITDEAQKDDNYCYELAARLYDKYGDDIFNDIFGNF